MPAPSSNPSHDSEPYDSRERVIVWGVWLLHLLVLAVVALRHEPWQDETHAWRLAIDSPDLRTLVANTRYEGHPLLWYLVLHALGKVSREWWLVAAFHTAMASATTWLILRCAPMALWQRIALVFGYYVVFEYAIVVRSYGLGMLLAMSACWAWTARRRRPVLAGLLLLALAFTSAMGLLVAASMTVGFFANWYFDEDGNGALSPGRVAGVAALLVVIGMATALAVSLQILPPADFEYRGDGVLGGSVSAWGLSSSLAMPAKAFLPIATVLPEAGHWLPGLVQPASRVQWVVADLVAAAFLLLALLTCIRRRSGLFSMVAGGGGMLTFTLMFLQGSARHHGHLVLIWIVSMWLSAAGRPGPSWWSDATRRAARFAPAAFFILQLPLLVAGVQYLVGDARLPFSDATNAADALRNPTVSSLPLVAASPADGMSVASHLERPVYSATEGRVTTFANWGTLLPELRSVPDGELLERAAIERAVRLTWASSCETLVIKSPDYPMPPSLQSASTLFYRTQGVTMTSERFEIWRVVAPPGAGRAC